MGCPGPRGSFDPKSGSMNSRPRIAHILHYQSPVGGGEHATLFLARHMRERGWDSVAYCPPSANASLRTFFLDHSIPVSALPQVPFSFYRYGYLRASWALKQDLARQEVGLIHCSDLPSTASVLYAAQMQRLPILCHVRRLWDHISPLEQLPLSLVRRFAFVSQAACDVFAYRAGAKRGEVVYDSIDICPLSRAESRKDLLAAFGLSDETKLIGMVARVGHHKDQETFIRAAKLLSSQYPDVRFMFVGDYEDPYNRDHYQKVRGWLRQWNMEDRFAFTGHRTDVNTILAGLDMSVLCTHGESLGLTVLEAMAQRTPVIGTAIGGVPEMIRHGRNGLLHPHKDANALADAMRLNLEAPRRAAAMAEQAFADLHARFGAEAYLNRMDRLYRSMVA